MVMRKLKSQRGMSILLAMLLLLVCAMAGAAALTAAASNVGRYTHIRQDQQRYLAVASAARLVRDELCAGEYSASATLTETHTYSPRDNGEGGTVWVLTSHTYGLDAGSDGSYTGTFESWLESHATTLFQYREIPLDWWEHPGCGTRPSAPGTLTCDGLKVQVTPAVGADALEPILSQVKWTLEMKENYSLSARFWVEETDKNGKVSTYYTTTLTIPASVSTSNSMTSKSVGNSDITTRTQNLTVTWPETGAVIRQN